LPLPPNRITFPFVESSDIQWPSRGSGILPVGLTLLQMRPGARFAAGFEEAGFEEAGFELAALQPEPANSSDSVSLNRSGLLMFGY